jgi:hypothetical protein
MASDRKVPDNTGPNFFQIGIPIEIAEVLRRIRSLLRESKKIIGSGKKVLA